VAQAGVVPIGQFTGTYQEGFEDAPTGVPQSELAVFDGQGVVRSTTGDTSIFVGASSHLYGVVTAHSGILFMGSWTTLEWEFDAPAVKWGGYFTTNSGTDDATAYFYDAGGALLGTGDVSAPADTTWAWNGWESDTPISRVEVVGFGVESAFIDYDDMELTPIPEPSSLGLLGLAIVFFLRK
jgi:hypothetical protein